ncbi:c-type cytochrome [Pontibacter lucknowensis]|uniref:Cytochrome c n=1 Tax=Pontibacter lucknowensis TaxID=1077936 RepID=A0A1N6W298_9BACT|nr:c-type cytochrome [Pontibacter lucknowensis]SIQ84239.1 Cytochrome c [Pontibacter lucknowensis]
MKTILVITSLVIFSFIMFLSPFSKGRPDTKQASFDTMLQGDKEQLKLGEHLVTIAACHDCHTPKKMTDKGMEMDFSRALSGHPATLPPPDVNREEVEKKGLVVTQTLTAWVGPWGISYAANLTSDETGIGNWTEKHFFTAIRQGKHKGLETSRMLLPPMPWDMYKNMTDEELRAVFAYLKSTKPIKNVVPAPQPPVAAAERK